MNCKNCNNEINLKFCPNCGQPALLERIDRHYITHEIEHLLHFERGILYTIKELALHPGATVRLFLNENRTRLVKPIIFIIIASVIYSIVNSAFHIEEGYVNYDDKIFGTTGKILKWSQDHYGYSNICVGIFVALWIKLFFKKSNYNFYEILILNCFVIGMAMFIYTIFALIQGLTHVQLLHIGGIIGFIYSSWAIGQFFNKKKAVNYFKAFAAYILGMISLLTVLLIIGLMIDAIKK